MQTQSYCDLERFWEFWSKVVSSECWVMFISAYNRNILFMLDEIQAEAWCYKIINSYRQSFCQFLAIRDSVVLNSKSRLEKRHSTTPPHLIRHIYPGDNQNPTGFKAIDCIAYKICSTVCKYETCFVNLRTVKIKFYGGQNNLQYWRFMQLPNFRYRKTINSKGGGSCFEPI